MYNAWFRDKVQERKEYYYQLAEKERQAGRFNNAAEIMRQYEVGEKHMAAQQNGIGYEQEQAQLREIVEANSTLFAVPESAEDVQQRLEWSQQLAETDGLFPRSASVLYNAQLLGQPFMFAGSPVFRTKPAHMGTDRDGNPMQYPEQVVANFLVSLLDTDTLRFDEPVMVELQGRWLIPQLRDLPVRDMQTYIYTVGKNAQKSNNPWMLALWADVQEGVHQSVKRDNAALRQKEQAIANLRSGNIGGAPTAQRPGSTTYANAGQAQAVKRGPGRPSAQAQLPEPTLRHAATGKVVEANPPQTVKRGPGRPRKAPQE